MQAISNKDPTEPLMVAGDFNCRIDIPNNRGQTLTDAMEEEGFTLLNNAASKTY